VSIDLKYLIDFNSRKTQFNGFSAEIETSKIRNNNLKPHCFTCRKSSSICSDEGFPCGSESRSQVCTDLNVTTCIFNTCDVNLLSVGFLSYLLHHYSAVQHIYSPNVGWCGLVERLYLFTLYALPLTMLCIAFGSDCPLQRVSQFNTALIILDVAIKDGTP
jgi:hypothetical protein